MPKVGAYTYTKSNRKGKKLMTVVDGKKIHFGSTDHEQYKDKTGIWKSKDHGNVGRRENYHKRNMKIKTKDGKLAYKNPKSPAYHSQKVLW
jgi:hypothetical protein